MSGYSYSIQFILFAISGISFGEQVESDRLVCNSIIIWSKDFFGQEILTFQDVPDTNVENNEKYEISLQRNNIYLYNKRTRFHYIAQNRLISLLLEK